MVSILKKINISVASGVFALALIVAAAMAPTSSAAAGDSVTMWPGDWTLEQNATVVTDQSMSVVKMKEYKNADGSYSNAVISSWDADSLLTSNVGKTVEICVKFRNATTPSVTTGFDVSDWSLQNTSANFTYAGTTYAEKCKTKNIVTKLANEPLWVTLWRDTGATVFVRYVRLTIL